MGIPLINFGKLKIDMTGKLNKTPKMSVMASRRCSLICFFISQNKIKEKPVLLN